MINFFFFVLLIPLCLFGSTKDELLSDFATHVVQDRFVEAHRFLNAWEAGYAEDFHTVNICRAFLLLRDSCLEEATYLFEEHFPSALAEGMSYSISYLFYGCLSQIESTLFKTSKCKSALPIVLCKRGWKIKAVIGAILVGTGAIVAAVNPAIGGSMITTGLGFVADGTIGSIDEQDEMMKERDAQRRREEEELKGIAFTFPAKILLL
ncbi:hypothetical protein [Candidatus Neptunochlamydia vexilliferae]|uniref:Uncharacterized protein n=1 Tax=Candidatus Neptunichlamydia vexilliferae TaxID=1651774 RepID=A0ABS0AZM1_9BACT|nr:hypothetical protein [Candidatus Neptunochlamydia vexilliferae]MBF5059394.1 hypothetical protein [Candidatus Neptunochlamydia vexilliferae]